MSKLGNSINHALVGIAIDGCQVNLSSQDDRYTVPQLIQGLDISGFGHEHITVDFSAVTKVDTASAEGQVYDL
ncbi:hypothetical protein CXF85_08645 [Colwellia sp. 75C3]|uniref:hypothetical protein n=1 Tax=Colwellia sp. 75C3 TaxID=888425 RepID=UPI000C33F1FB|nr:hypothetical protein [Colwellia sp. 75C3]PKG84380.1 hypothetical protein CXF85_08645 [Colwellia sp. 75C3]